MIYKTSLLTDDQVKNIKTFFNQNFFEDGIISNVNSSKELKNNLILNDKTQTNRFNLYIRQILNDSDFICKILCTKLLSQAYLLWYKEGMHYDYHIDNNPIAGVNAHMSMTCFLSDPDEYEGGELVIKVGDIETTHKPKAGEAIIYSTGLWHKVNPVISGERKVIVCWLENLINDSFIRNYLIEYGIMIENTIRSSENNTIKNSNKLIQQMEQFRINLMREYANF